MHLFTSCTSGSEYDVGVVLPYVTLIITLAAYLADDDSSQSQREPGTLVVFLSCCVPLNVLLVQIWITQNIQYHCLCRFRLYRLISFNNFDVQL